MRLGIFTGGAGEADTLDSLIAQAQQAETAGFDSFWLPNLPRRNYDALLVMALAGRETTRIECGRLKSPDMGTPPQPPGHAVSKQITTVAWRQSSGIEVLLHAHTALSMPIAP